MKRFLLFALLMVVSCAGSGPTPPVVTPPPPCVHMCDGATTTIPCDQACPQPTPPRCGNGKCDQGETPATCPKDCQPQTQPSPRPTVRPKGLPPFPIKMFGAYVGISVDPKVDYDQVARQLLEAGYNSVSDFDTTAFGSINKAGTHPLWPWPIKNGKFDFNHLDPEWQDNLYRFDETMAFWRIARHHKFFDQFHSPGDSPGLDPFRVGLGTPADFDPESLYSSYNFHDGKFHWIQWDDVGQHQTNFRCLNDLCRGISLYIDYEIATEVRVKALYPDSTFSWVWANETFGECDMSSGKCVGTQRKQGDRDEVFSWVYAKWKAAGFVEGKQYSTFFDFTISNKGKHKTDPDYYNYAEMGKAYQKGIKGKWHSNVEIHGILTTPMVAKYIANGVEAIHFLPSTDGDLNMVADYRGLGASAFNTDLKFDIRRGEPWSATNWMINFNRYFPRYEHYVK